LIAINSALFFCCARVYLSDRHVSVSSSIEDVKEKKREAVDPFVVVVSVDLVGVSFGFVIIHLLFVVGWLGLCYL